MPDLSQVMQKVSLKCWVPRSLIYMCQNEPENDGFGCAGSDELICIEPASILFGNMESHFCTSDANVKF